MNGSYYNKPLTFKIQMQWSGELIFDATNSNFTITSINAFTLPELNFIDNTTTSSLTLTNAPVGDYSFTLEAIAGTTHKQYTIDIS